MNDAVMLAGAGVAGVAIGAIFFGGLWVTVRKGASSTRPALWYSGSLLLRMSTAMAGFYLVGRGQWVRMVVCLVGFLMARLVVTWLARPPAADRPGQVREANYAP